MKLAETGKLREHTYISVCSASTHKHLLNALSVLKTIVTVKDSNLKIEQKIVNNHLFLVVDIN